MTDWMYLTAASTFTAGLFAYAGACIAYVYAIRGNTRFESFSEYLRKGWPIFTPLNCLLYMLTQRRAKRPIMDLKEFQELDAIKEHWQTIREEAINLHQQRSFDATVKPDAPAYYDIGFRTFYKYGWSKFYVKWYGYVHESAKHLCPKTVEILSKIPSVNGAMFSVLPPGSKLTRHLDPVACSLRYHLGLETPGSEECFINIDGVSYAWRNGEALLFDETYLHFARNDSGKSRLILMCDVERPMNFIGKIANLVFKRLMRLTIVPNMEGDKRGLANSIFSRLAPLLKRTKALKSTNRQLYLLVKHSVNLTLLALACASLAGLLYVVSRLMNLPMM